MLHLQPNPPEGFPKETQKFVSNILKTISEASASKPRVRVASSYSITLATAPNQYPFHLSIPSKGE
jgi:hypothetical protein